MNAVQRFTPVDIARKVAALGVIVNPAIAWTFVRSRFAEEYPGLPAPPPAELSVSELDLDVWLDEFLDHVDAERNRLTRNMQQG